MNLRPKFTLLLALFLTTVYCAVDFFLAFSLKSAAAVTEKSAMSVVRVNQNNKVAGCKIKTMRWNELKEAKTVFSLIHFRDL